MSIFGKLLGNPMLKMLLMSQGKKGRVAAQVLSGVDAIADNIKDQRSGSIDFMDMSLAIGGTVAQVAPELGITVVNDKLKDTVGMGTTDAINTIRQMKDLSPLEITGRVAAVGVLPSMDPDADD